MIVMPIRPADRSDESANGSISDRVQAKDTSLGAIDIFTGLGLTELNGDWVELFI